MTPDQIPNIGIYGYAQRLRIALAECSSQAVLESQGSSDGKSTTAGAMKSALNFVNNSLTSIAGDPAIDDPYLVFRSSTKAVADLNGHVINSMAGVTLQSGGSWLFDGTPGCGIIFNASPDWAWNLQDMSWDMDVKPISLPASGAKASLFDTATATVPFGLWSNLDSTGDVNLTNRDQGNEINAASPPLQVGVWQTVRSQRLGGVFRQWMNNSSLVSADHASPNSYTDQGLTIGRSSNFITPGGGEAFHGYIRNIRFYNGVVVNP